MKPLNEIEQDVADLLASATLPDIKPLVLAKILKRLKFLETCVTYLESGATDEFITLEYIRVGRILNVITKRYDVWRKQAFMPDKTEKQIIAFYNQENQVPKLKQQLKALTYLK